jgi:hypothetical protein
MGQAAVAQAVHSWSPARSLSAAALGASLPALTYVFANRIGGLHAALVAGGTATLVAFAAERRLTGSAAWSWLGLAGLVGSLALVAVTDNASFFFVRSVVVRGGWGAVFLVSAAVGRPAVGALFGWLVPGDLRPQLDEHQPAFVRVTLVWGAAELLKAAIRGHVMATGTLEEFTVVLIATGWPVEAALLGMSIWYLRRAGVALPTAMRRSDG